MSQPDWEAERRRLRRRALAHAGLIFGPALGVLLIVGATADHPAYVPGDWRNEPLYWIVTAGVGIVAAVGILGLSIRELRRRDD